MTDTTATNAAANERPRASSAGFWRLTWQRFRRYKLGMAGLALVLALLAIGFFAPILANEHPIVCRYEGSLYFPGIVETIQNLPFASRVISKGKPFSLATFSFKDSFDAERGDWALMPPIPYGPLEIPSDPHQGPSRKHWLGTDEVGPRVERRLGKRGERALGGGEEGGFGVDHLQRSSELLLDPVVARGRALPDGVAEGPVEVDERALPLLHDPRREGLGEERASGVEPLGGTGIVAAAEAVEAVGARADLGFEDELVDGEGVEERGELPGAKPVAAAAHPE